MEELRHRGRDMIKERYQLKFEHISRESKLMNLYDAFECAFTYACLHLKSFNSISIIVWCMLVVGLNDEIKN
jgi:hypothetical protein